MAKQLLVYVMCVGMLMATSSIVAAQPQEPGAQMTLIGTVEAVDHKARTVTIRGSGGVAVTLDVPPDAVRFEQVKVGDAVTATFYDRVSLRLKPAGEPAVDRTLEPTTAATPGDLPGATRTRQRVTTVTITSWDPVNKVVTFTGPNGTPYSRRLLDSTDPKIVEGLKAGDRVDVTRTEAVTLAVQPATTESLRNRLTVSVLFGLDNQFSGKMIEEATGRTTGGAAINLEETTYDEVYGRIGIFKVGVGYRTTPRTEAVVNFVYAKSDAQDEATQIGTVGTTVQVPLTVNFTEYQVLGRRGRPAVVLRSHALHALCRLPRGHQPAPGHPRHVRRRASQSHAGTCRAGRQVLRKVVGVQPGSDRWPAHRRGSLRGDGRDAVAFHGRAVGRGLAGRRRPAGCQQRELPLVVARPGRRAHPVLSTRDRGRNRVGRRPRPTVPEPGPAGT